MTLELPGRRVLVLGLAASGRAAVRVLRDHGAEVFASDAGQPSGAHDLGVEVELGSHAHAMGRLSSFDLVVPSPGIPPSSEVLAAAVDRGVPVWSEVELAARLARAPLIAITGTNGKTTVTQMVGGIARAAGLRAEVCGNIGDPFVGRAHDASDADVFVVELSSFQLHFCHELRPRVAVLTNLAPDHIDWHGSFSAYRDDKARISARQGGGDTFVYPAAQPELARLAPAPGPALVAYDGTSAPPAALTGARAAGEPFVQDALAASAAARAYGIGDDAIVAALEGFAPDHHRIELVAEVDGVPYYDDSKATNAHAAVAAIGRFDRVVLIAGGRDRSGDLGRLASVAERIVAAVTIGEAGPSVAEALGAAGVPVKPAGSMAEAVAIAHELAGRGDVVLLSPACASFDMFTSYADRGRRFADAVRDLG